MKYGTQEELPMLNNVLIALAAIALALSQAACGTDDTLEQMREQVIADAPRPLASATVVPTPTPHTMKCVYADCGDGLSLEDDHGADLDSERPGPGGHGEPEPGTEGVGH
jgi:hypothetical protein